MELSLRTGSTAHVAPNHLSAWIDEAPHGASFVYAVGRLACDCETSRISDALKLLRAKVWHAYEQGRVTPVQRIVNRGNDGEVLAEYIVQKNKFKSPS